MVTTHYVKKFLLDSTDWTQVVDNDLTQEEKDAWKVYRQALRGLDSDSSLMILTWPKPPGKIKPLTFPISMNIEELMITNLSDNLY
jgi:hypothetical protein